MRWPAVVLAMALIVGLAAPAAAASSCSDVTVPVQLDVLLPAEIHGRLCLPPGGADRVQLLVHGATYDSRYWDEPLGGGRFSYVRQALGDGWATLAIDRAGYGASTPEPSALLTATTQALTVHQVISWLRTSFGTVLLVGHSVGSAVALIETSLYNDASAVALTALTHRVSPEALASALAFDVRPVTVDPGPLASRYDPGYLTTVPGRRAALFYGPHPDPALLAYDEATKGVVSATEMADAIAVGFTLPMSLGITRPVYLVDGELDALFCGNVLGGSCSSAAALTAEERPYFANSARFTAAVLPDAGHDLNFEPHAAGYEDALNAWADTNA